MTHHRSSPLRGALGCLSLLALSAAAPAGLAPPAARTCESSVYRGFDTRLHAAMTGRIAQSLGLTSLRYQTVEGLREAIGTPSSKACTYCWTGRD